MKKIEITNPDKIIFPKEKITKLDIIKYYYDIAKLILPFIKGRKLSLIRCHNSIEKGFFIKKHPSNEKNLLHVFKEDGEEYFYVEKNYEIINQVQNGTLEFHISGSTIKNPDKPNLMIFDLDPDEKLSIKKLQEAVYKIKEVLDELNLVSFLKTSGGKGYHIVIPFKPFCDYKKFYDFSYKVALHIESLYPKIFTTNIRKEKRKGKIFIDYLRNNKNSTCVSPYSLRARDGASISFPISWDDLFKIKPNEINIKNYKKYLNDSWKNFNAINQKIK